MDRARRLPIPSIFIERSHFDYGLCLDAEIRERSYGGWKPISHGPKTKQAIAFESKEQRQARDALSGFGSICDGQVRRSRHTARALGEAHGDLSRPRTYATGKAGLRAYALYSANRRYA
jgi:hypothetical protein